ncbi:MAG: tetratricopeptide repeat protein [Bacteroidia bacterium]
MTGSGTFNKHSRLWLLLILLVSAVLYSPILKNDFAVDDFPAIVDNSLVQKGVSGIPEIFEQSYYFGYDERAQANEYRPISSSFYAIEKSVFGKENALPYHALSILLYLLVLVVIFTFIKKLSDSPTALLATALYAALPVHSEVVANIKAQDDLLAALFIFLSLRLWIEKERPYFLVLSLLTFTLALFSKEASLPLVLLFPTLDYLKTKKLSSRALWFLAPIVLYMGARMLVLEPVEKVEVVNNALAFASGYGEQSAMGFAFFLHYILLLLYPGKLSWDYSFNHFELHGWANWQSLSGLALFIALVYIALRGLKKPNLYSWLSFFFLISMFLYLHILFLLEATFAERFLFVPSFAFVLALAILIRKYGQLVWLYAGVGVVWMFLVWTRLPDWKNNATLFEADIEKVPNSIRANSALAYSLYEKAIETEEPDKAILDRSAELFRTAINIYGNDAPTWYNYGMCNLAMGDYTMAELCFMETLRLRPDHTLALNNLGNIHYLKGEHDLAKGYYIMAIKTDIDNAEAWSNLGAEYLLIHQDDSAYNALDKALQLDPKNENAQHNLNLAKKRLGRP